MKTPLLWKHITSGHFRVTSDTHAHHASHGVTARSNILLESSRPVKVAAEKVQVEHSVVRTMRNDEAKLQVQGDTLILNFASVLLRKLGHSKVQGIAQ